MVPTLLLASCALALLRATPQEQDAPRVERRLAVTNPSDHARRQIVRASVPFARGELRDAASVAIDGELAFAVPLLRWPDGSVAVLQAHFALELSALESRSLSVTPAAAPAAAPPPGSWPFEDGLPLYTEVADPWGQVYTAKWIADDQPVESLSSPLVRVRRFRGVHRRGSAEFLGAVAYLVSYRGTGRGELTVVLDNGAHVPDPDHVGLGPVRLRSFALCSSDERLRFRPRFASENALSPPEKIDGGHRQLLLGPSDQIYLGDRTAKAFRFDLFIDEEGAPEARRVAAAEAAAAPLLAWPRLSDVRRTRAFGAHGGPAPTSTDRSAARWLRWRQSARFGPFGGHGDPEDAAAQGTPRNGPSALHNVVRWRSPRMLSAAETMVLQHGLRPTPGTTVRYPDDLASFRRGLSPRSRQRPHGFTALDYEHFSVDLLYDYYWLTGDLFAREELRRMGRGLRPILDTVPFLTSRGEGWCLQAGVLIARATGDAGLLEYLHARARSRVLPEISGPPTTVALAQPPHEAALGPSDWFDAPWQMAALVHGLHALFGATADPEVADAAVQIARVMAGPGWVEGVGPKYLVSARQSGRYILPVGHGPMEGTASMEIGAFVLAADMTQEAADRALFGRRAKAIVDANWAPGDDEIGADRWLQLHLDRAAVAR